jgi:hypothetical protein
MMERSPHSSRGTCGYSRVLLLEGETLNRQLDAEKMTPVLSGAAKFPTKILSARRISAQDGSPNRTTIEWLDYAESKIGFRA